MPTIALTLSRQFDRGHTRRIVNELVEHTTNILDKPFGRTALFIRYVNPNEWFIAGKSLEEFCMNSFRVEVTVVDETVTKAQKAKYCAAVFKSMSLLIDDLHPFSNIYVIDVKGASYGYGGLTQECVLHHPANAEFLEVKQ